MNGYRILVVDDDATSGAALRRLLAHRGYVVSVAQTVTEAMKNLETAPHYILLDLMLPDGDGEDILRKVKEENLPSRVLVCTGTSDPVRLALVKGLNPDALFQKPIDFDEICRACENDTVD
ncbi:MAG: response regulator [Planctomycetia bacterium]|nr:response regulator [Planctomycetia bacterium]